MYINLIEVGHHNFNPDEDIKNIYKLAKEAAQDSACIIVFDKCDIYYRKGYANHKHIGAMRKMLDKIRLGPAPIWAIFLSNHNLSTTLDPAIYDILNQSVWTGVLEKGERTEAIKKCINSKLYKGQEFPLKANEVNALVNNATNTVYGDIEGFVNAVWHKRAHKVYSGKPESSYVERNSQELVPCSTDFQECYYYDTSNMPRITRFDPSEYNVKPYSFHAYMEQDNGFGMDH